MEETVLKVTNLRKNFGKLEVLKGLSFTLSRREILGVVGPSGGGKSTLLRCLNFLEWPTEGDITYCGRIGVSRKNGERHLTADDGSQIQLGDIDLCRFRSRVGFVFQAFNLWEERSVMGNLTLAPRVVLGHSRRAAEDRAGALCKQFGIAAKLNARVADLSGGQRQRVAIIRALMMEPSVMLLDEVTSALDPVLTLEVMQAIRQLRDRGLTMVVVTHHIEFAASLCDRIMFLSGGVALQIDTPAKLRSHPVSDEIGSFLDVLQRAR